MYLKSTLNGIKCHFSWKLYLNLKKDILSVTTFVKAHQSNAKGPEDEKVQAWYISVRWTDQLRRYISWCAKNDKNKSILDKLQS